MLCFNRLNWYFDCLDAHPCNVFGHYIFQCSERNLGKYKWTFALFIHHLLFLMLLPWPIDEMFNQVANICLHFSFYSLDLILSVSLSFLMFVMAHPYYISCRKYSISSSDMSQKKSQFPLYHFWSACNYWLRVTIALAHTKLKCSSGTLQSSFFLFLYKNGFAVCELHLRTSLIILYALKYVLWKQMWISFLVWIMVGWGLPSNRKNLKIFFSCMKILSILVTPNLQKQPGVLLP